MSSNQGQQWPSVGKVSSNGHMELLAILSVIFIFILISIHLYARYRRREESVTITIRHSSTPTVIAPPEGLDAATIAALPRFIFRSGSSPTRSAEECAVCLNVAEEGEVMRMLPDCKHVFHIECIDMWLHSHSTCPVCRTKATPGMLKIGFCGFLASPPLPERFGGASSRPVQGDASPPKEGSSEPSQVLRAGNGSRRWLTVVEDGAVDLERQ